MDNRERKPGGMGWWRNRIFRHGCYWLLAYGLLFLTVLFYDTQRVAFQITTIIAAPGPLPVYLNFFLLRRFFERKKYFLYFLSLVGLILGSGALIEFVFYWIMQDPDSHISGMGIALFYIALTTGLKYYAQGLRQQARLHEAEAQRARAELALLRSQVNPHFFFNTLNSLYALSLDRSERLPEVILKLSALMRYVLEGSEREEVSLEKELAFIRDYTSLEQLRLGGHPDIRIEVEGDLTGKRIAPMLLMPFVENGFKHGLNRTSEDGLLHVRLAVGEKRLVFSVENTRAGELADSGGLGLKNVRRRLELLYPETHRLEIRKEENRFRIELELPS